MTIDGIDTSGASHQPNRLQSAPRTDAQPAPGVGREDQRTSGQDRVEISETARELSRLSETHGPETSRRSLDAEHIRTIMTRLSDGFYDSPEVQLEIANRIRAAGPDAHSGVNQL